MGKLLSVLSICLFLSALANGQSGGDDARIMSGNIPSADQAMKTQTSLLKQTDPAKAVRSVHLECYWLGRYQEALYNLSGSVNLPAYGENTSGRLILAVHKVGAYCGLSTNGVESPVEDQNRESLHAYINKEVKPLVDSIKARADQEHARYAELKGKADGAIEDKNRAVEKANAEVQSFIKRTGIPGIKLK